ncbi:leucine-rich repeat extensin-like protein 5 isoform X3 [Brassica napus]|uniref:leucine-rich repeat extensin-like protein 5 isoform X3 n=1 Tax=Brassica napus TaxID=3708 RepID=UPI0006AA780B|nr:leucine-rich repeat extensin-like protein 5 isoform X3 [Brassica napus]XP_048596055.1 leucine-rich repeat extensin-like protein 5 isoform X3 [Brassica napus]XP_048596056.1 leucine-rich repeat extensin-like protein 5 isoform X3 [Brassica napus]
MLLLVGTPPRMTRSVSRRGEASASPTPSSLPLVITRRSNVSESACVSVTKSPPVLPSKPEPPDLFPVEQIEPLFETFPPPDPPFKTPSPPEPPDPPLKAPSPMCPPEPPDPPDVLKVKIITIADPPDHDHSGAPDLFSFTLKIAEPPHVSGFSSTISSGESLVSLFALRICFERYSLRDPLDRVKIGWFLLHFKSH